MKQIYDANSIESLSFKDGVRTRISMYLGTPDTEGIYQALKEVINNSTDEALMGFGNRIEITVDEKQNFVSVTDEGRGIPFQVKEDGTNVLVNIFTKAHTGGKFNNKAYTTSSGLNGIGIKATCLSSELFEAQSVRDGKVASVFFKKGILQNYKEVDNKYNLPNGTYIRFKPDREVFVGMTDGFTFNRICSEIENISYLNKGIHFIVKNNNPEEEREFYSKNGIADFIKSKMVKPLMKEPIICSAKDETDELEVAFIWTGGHEQSYVFVNGLFCEMGGSPITGAKTAISSSVKKLSGKAFEPDLIRRGLVYAINCKVSEPQFANQTKNSIGNKNLRTLASQAFKEGLQKFSHTNEFNIIIDILNRMQKAENAADKAREAVLNHNQEMDKLRKSKLAFIEKLKDSEELGENSILLCVEGNSAASMVAKARKVDKFGLLSLKGKIINCLSNTEEKYLANEEIKLLLYAMGIDINNYNPKKLRYGKIGICVDGDE